MSTVLSRWKAKLATRLQLLKNARARHVAHPTPDTRATLDKRKAQVGEAQRVVGRHSPVSHISPVGVNLIAEFEGCRLKPYRDAVGVWTIGYGHTEHVGPHTPPLHDQDAAMALLRKDLDDKYAPPVSALKLPLNQHQFDALVSFVYNVGPGGIGPNTGVGRALRAHDWHAAADHLLDWDKAGGRRLAGLTRRRKAERELFLTSP